MFAKGLGSFPEREEEILAFWEQNEVFLRSLNLREGSPLFSFYDGPPFATGLPHYGHLIAGTIKDVIPRYQTMKGFYVPRCFGWDCHGLPVENEIERTKNISGAHEIETLGIATFNAACEQIVLRYTAEWERTIRRLGRWVDFRQTYRTMDRDFMETIWWVFGQLWEKGLIYEGFKVMPFSAKLGTPLSNFEANLNYQEVEDPSIVVILPLLEEERTSLLIWTTTPWTLPANLAVAVNEELSYVKIFDRERKHYFILGEGRAKAYFNENIEVISTFKGSCLLGKRYRPPFDYFFDQHSPHAFKVISGSFVDEKDGTGIVHVAPAFGEVDFLACQKEGIPLMCPIDQNGRFTDEVPDYKGLFVKDSDRKIIQKLKGDRRIFDHRQIRHRYPFCWRSDTPLIYKAVNTWFLSVEQLKERLLIANEKIRWVPSHLKAGRFGKWLENSRDWAISRNRYWGTPIPLWRSERGEIRVIDSLSMLENRVGKKVDNLHRHHIDGLSFSEGGDRFVRIPEVFDCWFESGAMPYAKNHFPFENEEETLRAFPADFVAEGLDQTRGWFYTLNVLSVALFDRPAFKNVVVNGIILAKDGAKMSKRLKNYPEPDHLFAQYGADAVRLYLLRSAAIQGEDLRFSDQGVELVLRQALIPLWNSYLFLATYGDLYRWMPSGEERDPSLLQCTIDRWLFSLLHQLIERVEESMDRYQIDRALSPFLSFIDQLTNWYIRRNRSRFWEDRPTEDRESAFYTLYTVLFTLSKVAAPFIPFLSEAIYRNLRLPHQPISVHLCDFPRPSLEYRDRDLEKKMEVIQTVVHMGHALRKEHALKVRQPLSKAYLISANEERIGWVQEEIGLILEELNVKECEFCREESRFVTRVIKPNFRVLGKKVGGLMKEAAKAVGRLDVEAMHQLNSQGRVKLSLATATVILTEEDVIVERKVKEGMIAATQDELTIVLDPVLTETLLEEGMAREVVNKINRQRKNERFAITDRVKVLIETTPFVQKAWESHALYIQGEILATEVQFVERGEGTEWVLNGERAVIALKKSKSSSREGM